MRLDEAETDKWYVDSKERLIFKDFDGEYVIYNRLWGTLLVGNAESWHHEDVTPVEVDHKIQIKRQYILEIDDVVKIVDSEGYVGDWTKPGQLGKVKDFTGATVIVDLGVQSLEFKPESLKKVE